MILSTSEQGPLCLLINAILGTSDSFMGAKNGTGIDCSIVSGEHESSRLYNTPLVPLLDASGTLFNSATISVNLLAGTSCDIEVIAVELDQTQTDSV